jgi:chemotaxis protein histidine kinase CheA
MKSSLDSIGLFIKQVKQHAEVLTELLSNGLDPKQVSDLMEQCIVSTNMLSGSTTVMGLDGWQDCLSACESLISRYRNLSLPWDERIAQIVSELIEKEELLVSAHEGGDICDLSSIVSQDELRALLEEANVLLDTELVPAVTEPENQLAPTASPPRPDPTPVEETEPAPPGLFPGCSAALKAAVDVLFDEIANRDLVAPDLPGGSLDGLRKQLFLIDYYARSMDEIACSRQGGGDSFVTCSLQAV